MGDRNLVAAPVITITPSDIDTNGRFWDAFGSLEEESEAWFVVVECKRQKGWLPFRLQDLGEKGPVSIHRLLRDGYVIKNDDGTYQVTKEFVFRCRMSSPKEPKA